MADSIPVEIDCPQVSTDITDESSNLRLIDCREADELAICSLGSAQHCPLSEWGDKWATWFPDRDQRIVILCHHGMRSLQATTFLRNHGFANAQSMSGGIDAWSRLIDPAVSRY